MKQDQPESEWLIVEAPELRIFAEDAWATAHARLERTRQTYHTPRGLGGRPESGMEAPSAKVDSTPVVLLTTALPILLLVFDGCLDLGRHVGR